MPTDPFRVLGLPRDATMAEIKGAYRRLAKAFHPDAAGEAAVARFLQIQAAYETLVGGTDGRRGRGRRGSGRPPAQEPWQADPDRVRETRGAGRTRTRRGPTEDRPNPGRPGRGDRPRDWATPGSTNYDGADEEPSDPGWSGAAWYGTSSGTYWTINPREYADPRKHGPEYQARARRRWSRTLDQAEEPPAPAAEPSAAASRPPPTAGAGPRPSPAGGPPSAARRPRFTTVPPRDGPSADGPPTPRHLRALDDARRTISGRLVLAVVGWVPIGIALAIALGESSGCSRFTADCDGPFGLATLVGQGSVVALLLLLPRLAVIATLGTVSLLMAALPSVAALSIVGGGGDPGGTVPALATILIAAWAVGIVVGVGREGRWFAADRRPPVP